MATGGAIKAGEAFIELSLKGARGFSGKLTGAVRSMGRLAATAAKVGVALTAAFGAATLGFISRSVQQFVKIGDQIDKMAQRTGASAEALSQLGFAAEQSGTDISAVEKGFRGMARSFLDLEQGMSTAVDSFGALNLSLRDLQDLNPDQRFELIADRLSQIEDPTRRAALAMEIFGRAGTELLPLFNQGAEGIQTLRQQADILGRTVSGEQAAKAAKLADTWNELRSAIAGVGIEIGSAVAPALTRAVGALRDFLLDWEIWVASLKVVFFEFLEDITSRFETDINRLGRLLERVVPQAGMFGVGRRAGTSLAGGAREAADRAQEDLAELLKQGRPSEQLRLAHEQAQVIGEEVSRAIKATAESPGVGIRSLGGFGARAEQFGVNSVGRRQLRAAERLVQIQEKMNERIQQAGFFTFI